MYLSIFIVVQVEDVDREAERNKAKQEGNAESDQSERAKGRSLPDEQKGQEHDRGRSR